MSYKELKREVFEANMELQRRNLVIYTFGNVSQVDRDKGVVAIKPSGVAYEDMKPEDSATFYYCFTKAGFKGSGIFYKYIQKAVTKTIRAFSGPDLRLMFYKFD